MMYTKRFSVRRVILIVCSVRDILVIAVVLRMRVHIRRNHSVIKTEHFQHIIPGRSILKTELSGELHFSVEVEFN